jgi:hypothetical protein
MDKTFLGSCKTPFMDTLLKNAAAHQRKLDREEAIRSGTRSGKVTLLSAWRTFRQKAGI